MKQLSPKIDEAYRFSIAPMLDCTDRHFRVLMRQISQRALLYTEMVVANALHHTNRVNDLLDFDEIEHPIALQIGGDNPKILKAAAQMANEWGYDEINLNIGCPSPRVKAGNFGACLMANPTQVARCIEAMVNATPLIVTVKHRLGIDNLDSDELLTEFVDCVAKAGAQRFSIHARKAWLNGLNPKQNRTIPPLQYERVELLKQKRPELKIELNGGLKTPKDCLEALSIFDGTMVGRAAYEHPLRWQAIDTLIFDEENDRNKRASTIIKKLLPYAEKHLQKNGRLWDLCRHLLQLVEDVPGARKWRRNLSLKGQKTNAGLIVLEEAARQLEEVGL